MTDDLFREIHGHNDDIITREIMLPAFAHNDGRPAVTGLSWAPDVYDYVFGDSSMTPHHVERFLREAAAASALEIMIFRQEESI